MMETSTQACNLDKSNPEIDTNSIELAAILWRIIPTQQATRDPYLMSGPTSLCLDLHPHV